METVILAMSIMIFVTKYGWIYIIKVKLKSLTLEQNVSLRQIL